MSTPLLFTPITVDGIEARNRLWVSPMCQYAVVAEDGVPNDWHVAHLGSLAAGGAGLVITESTAVVPEGRISPRDTGIWNQAQQDSWTRVVQLMHDLGTRVALQLGHAGRKASTIAEWGTTSRGTVPIEQGGWSTVGPSPGPFDGLESPAE